VEDKKYNGWHNYETWRVNLEIFDGFDPYEYFTDLDDSNLYQLGQSLKDYAEQVIFECGECDQNSLAGSYAQAFLDAVNWHEIAKNMVEAYKEEITA
jgi:hypothetical protein